MGKLVIKLDKPIIYCLVEGNQLILAEELPADDVSQILDKVGDYRVSEVAVYMKFDTRQNVEGIVIDRIITEAIDYTFRVSEADYSFLKAVSLRFKARKLSFYSAYKHYASILTDGVVVDSYVDHNFIVAGLQDGQYQSLKVCSSERLQRTIEACQMAEITYAQSGAIPELANIEAVPAELHETLAFLQFVLYGTPSYCVDIDSGEVFEYGDKDKVPKHYSLLPEEYGIAIEAIRANLGPKIIKKKRSFSIKDIQIAAIHALSGVLFAVGLFGVLKVDQNSAALETKIAEQQALSTRQAVEERFLEKSIEFPTKGSFYNKLFDLNAILNNGAIMSVRFVYDKMELTLFVTDEPMMERALTELEQFYVVESSEFEKTVNNAVTGTTYMQYNIVLDPFAS